jgi:hypothetical protein
VLTVLACIVFGFDPQLITPSNFDSLQWTDLSGNNAFAPDYDLLTDPEAVLHGELAPGFENLWVRSDKTFVAGCLPKSFHELSLRHAFSA